MTSPWEKYQPGSFVCVCVFLCRDAWIKSTLFIWCNSNPQRHADSSSLAHSVALKDMPPSAQTTLWPLTYSMCATAQPLTPPLWPPHLTDTKKGLTCPHPLVSGSFRFLKHDGCMLLESCNHGDHFSCGKGQPLFGGAWIDLRAEMIGETKIKRKPTQISTLGKL